MRWSGSADCFFLEDVGDVAFPELVARLAAMAVPSRHARLTAPLKAPPCCEAAESDRCWCTADAGWCLVLATTLWSARQPARHPSRVTTRAGLPPGQGRSCAIVVVSAQITKTSKAMMVIAQKG